MRPIIGLALSFKPAAVGPVGSGGPCECAPQRCHSRAGEVAMCRLAASCTACLPLPAVFLGAGAGACSCILHLHSCLAAVVSLSLVLNVLITPVPVPVHSIGLFDLRALTLHRYSRPPILCPFGLDLHCVLFPRSVTKPPSSRLPTLGLLANAPSLPCSLSCNYSLNRAPRRRFLHENLRHIIQTVPPSLNIDILNRTSANS